MAGKTQLTVANITHPFYDEKFKDWQKWRYTYEGGQRFIDRYLQRFSRREGVKAFGRRREMSYNPAFSKSAIEEIKNAIFQRLGDITREGGSQSYQTAITGEDGGVDLLGSSMSSFIGRKVLPELLVMGRIGVYVDMPEVSGLTIADLNGKRPYVYVYRAEDIRSWSLDESTSENEYTNVLLRDYIYTYDDETGLATGLVSRFRRLWISKTDGKVHVQFYNTTGTAVNLEGIEAEDSEITLPIERIPFLLVYITDSLLADVANYQIALLNLASADMSYSLNSNFPFYTEQFVPNAESMRIRHAGKDQGGQETDAETGKSDEIAVGTQAGRRYPTGTERPAFIHPSSEPIQASMNKQEQLKAEIRQLVQLAVTNLQPTKQASAESKQMDQSGLESGLSYIGLELENMERKITGYWSMYEGVTPATIYYPETYDVKTEDERRAEAEHILKVLSAAPSVSYAKALLKRLAKIVLGRKVKRDVLEKIYKEIDDAPGTTGDPLVIQQDVITGIVDLKTAAECRGYHPKVVEAAAKDHADRLARIALTQSSNVDANGGDPAARGNPDSSGDPVGAASKEKQAVKDRTNNPTPAVKTERGKGVANNLPGRSDA